MNKVLRHVRPWMCYLALTLWLVWQFWQAATGQLGVEPVDSLLRSYGELGFYLLLVSLMVTPLRPWFNIMHLRRALSLSAFFALAAHLAVFTFLDLGSLSRLGQEILERPYITYGMLSFALLVPLALTSTDRMIRALGARWRMLHKLAYPAAVLGWIHYDLQIRGFDIKAFILGVILMALLMVRVFPVHKRR